MLSKEKLKKAFIEKKHEFFKAPPNAKESAVIVPFVELNNIWYVIFEKRVNNKSKHAGQLAFPGGSKDKEDKDFLQTAIRETCEEIGVCSEDLEILGEIEPTVTLTTNFVIYPFAAIVLKKPPYNINKSEVEKLVYVPVDYLINQYPFELKKYTYQGKEHITLVIPYNDEVIWGASARILNNTIPLLKDD